MRDGFDTIIPYLDAFDATDRTTTAGRPPDDRPPRGVPAGESHAVIADVEAADDDGDYQGRVYRFAFALLAGPVHCHGRGLVCPMPPSAIYSRVRRLWAVRLGLVRLPEEAGRT